MASNNLELLLKIIAQVDGLRDIEGLRESVEQLDPALSTLADRARAALNPMDGLSSSAHSFGQNVKEVTQPLSDLATKTLKVASVVTALSTALGGVFYNEAKKAESAQLDLKKVIGGTAEELEIYSQKLNALALEYGVSSNDLTQSMAGFAQAGYTAREALDLVSQSLKLKVAGDIDAAQSSDYLTQILKGFKAPASDAARLIDSLNEVSNNYATDVKQLAEGMSQVAPIAQKMGLSFESTEAILTPMIESFGSGSEAAEAFKTGMLQLINNSTPVQDALKSIGVAQTDLNGNLRSGKDILNDVMVAFQTTAQSQKLLVTQQLVGIDQAPRLVEVFDRLNKVTEIQNSALSAVSSAQREVNTRLKSAETIANRTSESFRQLAVALGTNYRDEVKAVVDATGDLARAFIAAEKAGSMDGLFDAVKPQLESVENLFRQVAQNLPEAFAHLDFSGLKNSIKDLGGEVGEAFHAMLGGIDLTTVDGTRQALQLVADAMAALIHWTAGVTDQMGPLFEQLGRLAKFAAENSDSVARMAGEVAGLSATVNVIVPAIAEFVSKTFSIIGTASEAAVKVGLLVAAIKLLNSLGVEVLPIIGRLAASIGGLSFSTAVMGSAFLGIPGALLATGTAAGVAGYGLGTVLNKGINATAESITGTNLGGLIYDLAEALGLENTEADRAKIVQEQLATALESQAKAAQAAAAAAREKQLADESEAKAAQEATDRAKAADETIKKLTASFQEAGLIWNQSTGELVRVSDAMNGIAKPSLTVKNALNELGIDWAKFTDSVSNGAEKVVLNFKKITEDVTASAVIVSTAMSSAINKAETIGDLDAISAAFDQFAATGKLSAADLANANRELSARYIELNEAQDPVLKNLEAIAKESSQSVQAAESLANAQEEVIRAEIALAKAKGNTAEAQRLSHELSIKEAEGALAVAKAKEEEQIAEYDVAKAKLNTVIALRQKNLATAEDVELAGANAKVQLAEAVAAQTNTQAQQVLLDGIKSGIGIKIKNQTATQSMTQATEENTDAQQVNIKETKDSGQAAQGLASYLASARKEMDALSSAARALFEVNLAKTLNQYGIEGAYSALRSAQVAYNEELAGGSEKLKEYSTELAQANELIKASEQKLLFASNGFTVWEASIEKATGTTKQAFYEQAIAAEQLRLEIEKIGETGVDQFGTLGRASNVLIDSFNLLDDQTLDNLRSSVDKATESIKKMQNEVTDAKNRLLELDAAIAEASGNDYQYELLTLQLDKTKDLAEAEEKLATAREEKNKEAVALYEEQIKKLNTLYALKLKNLAADFSADSSSSSTSSSTTSSSSSSNSGGSKGTYNLNVNVAGKTYSLQTISDPFSLVNALEIAQRSAL